MKPSAAIFVSAALLAGALCQIPAEAAQAAAPLASIASLGDLDRECQDHLTEAAQKEGWTRNRYEQCHRVPDQKINLYNTDGEYLGFMQFDLELEVYTEPSSRRFDILAVLKNVKLAAQLQDELAYLTVKFACLGENVTCNNTTMSDTVAGWYANPAWRPMWAESPNDTGLEPYRTATLDVAVSVLAEYRDGKTIPYEGQYAHARARFDSARAKLGNGPYHGTVLPDYVPTLQLSAAPGSAHRAEAQHVYDAQHTPIKTFPSILGKSVPGAPPAAGATPRPLHRLMDPRNADNHTEAVKVCKSVWGTNYAVGGLECDEYPFKSTYEGAAESTRTADFPAGNWQQWRGSARPIDGVQNRAGGTELGNFYGANRILDNDAFYIDVTR